MKINMKIQTIWISLLLTLFSDTIGSNNFKDYVLDALRIEFNKDILEKKVEPEINKIAEYTAKMSPYLHTSAVVRYPNPNPNPIFTRSFNTDFVSGSRIQRQGQNILSYPFDHIITVIRLKTIIPDVVFTFLASLKVGMPLLKIPKPILRKIINDVVIIEVKPIEMFKIRPHPGIDDFGRKISSIDVNQNGDIEIVFESEQAFVKNFQSKKNSQNNMTRRNVVSIMYINPTHRSVEILYDVTIDNKRNILTKKNTFKFLNKNSSLFYIDKNKKWIEDLTDKPSIAMSVTIKNGTYEEHDLDRANVVDRINNHKPPHMNMGRTMSGEPYQDLSLNPYFK